MTAMRNSNAKHTDFGFLKGIIKSNPLFMASNVDMMLERRGRFIVAEWKRPNENISRGQMILLENLAKQKNFMVMIITGVSDDTECNIYDINKLLPEGQEKIGEGKQFLIEFIKSWYNLVDTGQI